MLVLIAEILILSLFGVAVILFAHFVLFYGFTPFLPTRPDEIKKVIKEIRIKHNSVIFSLGAGSSGFLMVLEQHYPDIELIGVEDSLLPYLIYRAQVFLKKSRIKVIRSKYYWVDIKRADVVYCHLSLKEIREINKKLKIDTKPDALIVSNGFVIPYLDVMRTVELEERKRWFGFLKKGKKVVRTSVDEDKRENKVYYYQV